MSTYFQLTDVQAKIPPKFLTEALDDNLDGQIDAGLFEAIQAQVGNEIDGFLGQRYALPLQVVPAIISDAALVLACEAVYGRRVSPDQNPWTARATVVRTKLGDIAEGKQPLTTDLQRKDPSVSAIISHSKTFSHRTAV